MQTITTWFAAMSAIELGTLLTGIIYVVLAARENAWCWLFGLVNVILLFVLSYQSGLYADMGLQVVYLALTFYGAYQWIYGNQSGTSLPISHTQRQNWLIYAVITVAGTVLLTFILNHFTDSTVPFADAFTTILSLIATWMTARKELENWLVWVFTDILYIGLYAYKDLDLLAVLSVVYTVVAAVGYLEWRKKVSNTLPLA